MSKKSAIFFVKGRKDSLPFSTRFLSSKSWDFWPNLAAPNNAQKWLHQLTSKRVKTTIFFLFVFVLLLCKNCLINLTYGTACTEYIQWTILQSCFKARLNLTIFDGFGVSAKITRNLKIKLVFCERIRAVTSHLIGCVHPVKFGVKFRVEETQGMFWQSLKVEIEAWWRIWNIKLLAVCESANTDYPDSN